MMPGILKGTTWFVLLIAPVASGETFQETFSNGSNIGGWTYFSPGEAIETVGGNPGAYLHAFGLDTFAPFPRTTQPSVFTGDYRDAMVTSIGVDLITIDVDFSAEGRPLALMLYSDSGTPADPADDWAAYQLGPNIPLPGQGWLSYEFPVPSDSEVLPPGWATVVFGPSSPPNPDWNDVITNVSRLGFHYGDPTFFFIFQMWDVGLDNVRIATDSPVAAAGQGVEDSSWGRIKALYVSGR
jgi:hypothetical protein